VPDRGSPPEASVDGADEVARLLELVARLPEEERLAVQFFFLRERNVHEVASALGRSRSGTYALLQQAIATLARWMGVGRHQGEVTR
jgi:DNA-directed RNA polymerase specialized sigma subunit